MQDDPDDIRKFLEHIPDKFDISEKGIDAQTQKEYIEYSHTFNRGELTEEGTLALSNVLFDKKASASAKKQALALLAHLGTVLAFRQIEKYYMNPDRDLEQWAAMALQECKMFLESSLLEEDTGFVSSGLGGQGDRLRFYFLILPSTDLPFNKMQTDIIRKEFPVVCKGLNSVLENIDFSDTFAGLTILVPMDVAVGTVADTAIKKCNESGDVVFEYYYVTNQNIPDASEIADIIKIVKGDE